MHSERGFSFEYLRPRAKNAKKLPKVSCFSGQNLDLAIYLGHNITIFCPRYAEFPVACLASEDMRSLACAVGIELYINVDVRNGNLIKVLIFVGGELKHRLRIWKYSVC